MVRFSEEQKRIGYALADTDMTVRGLSEALEMDEKTVSGNLELMQKMQLVEKKDELFSLKEEIAAEIRRRKQIQEEDPFKLRVVAIIEMQAVEQELLEKQADKLTSAIKEDTEHFTVYDIKKAEIAEIDERYSTFLEVNFSVKDFSSLIHFMFFYGPTSVEVIKPAKIEIQAFDLQDGLMDMSDMIHKYTEYITRMMSRKDLDDFTKKLYK